MNFHISLTEGIRDPHIFKAIFTAGVPGSGKSTVSKYLIGGTGLRPASFDDVYEYLTKATDLSHPEKMDKSSSLVKHRLQGLIQGRLGLLIDRTSWNYTSIHALKEGLENLGYDTFMLYVNTDLDVARQRVADRATKTGRNVEAGFIDKAFAELSKNLGKYQQEFKGNFAIVDNTHAKADPNAFRESIKYAQKEIDRFLREQPRKREAVEWMNQQK